jgi:hypothetical protein
MSIDRRRHGRQIRLAEIGEQGQAKLSAARAPLEAQGFARTIEERYLRGAGLEILEAAGSVPTAPAVATLGLRNGAATEVADGALRALATIHRVLGSAD